MALRLDRQRTPRPWSLRGTQIQGFALQSMIGKGSFGIVYKAVRSTDKMTCAAPLRVRHAQVPAAASVREPAPTHTLDTQVCAEGDRLPHYEPAAEARTPAPTARAAAPRTLRAAEYAILCQSPPNLSC